MSTVREAIADQIKADNPAFIVRAFPVKAPDNLGKGKVFVGVYRNSLAPHATAAALTHSMSAEVMVGSTEGEAAETALEHALDEVLLSIQRLAGLRFTGAERTTFDDKYPGYSISVEADSADVYKQTILKEV